MSNGKQIAENTIAQLTKGTLLMLGYQGLAYNDNGGISFSIRGSKTCNKIAIELAANDTYTVTFIKMNRRTFEMKKTEVEGVYVDSLHRTIEAHTGLRTRL